MPLLLLPFILLYLVTVILLTHGYVKKQNTIKRKWLFGILLPALFFVGPFADEFVARAYFYNLCDTEGGVKIYKPVYLDEKFFDENNVSIFIGELKNPSTFELLGRYKGHSSNIYEHNSVFNIRLAEITIVDEKTVKTISKVISKNTSYLYDYGYIINSLSVAMPTQPITCHHYWKEKKYIELFEKTFIKTKGNMQQSTHNKSFKPTLNLPR